MIANPFTEPMVQVKLRDLVILAEIYLRSVGHPKNGDNKSRCQSSFSRKSLKFLRCWVEPCVKDLLCGIVDHY